MVWEHSVQKEIETPFLLAHAIEDSTDIFGISGGGWTPQTTPLGTPLLTGNINYTERVYKWDSIPVSE